MSNGGRFFGLSAIALGVMGLLYPQLAVGQRLPAGFPLHDIVLYATAALLILGGAAMNLPRAASLGAMALTGLLAFWVAAVNAPQLLARPAVFVSWESFCELVGMMAGAAAAWAMAGGPGGLARVSRLAFGLCLLVFGAAHFVYAKFSAPFVPAWLPPSQLFWVYATGVAQAAAGLALLSGVRARLAMVLLGAMYALFALLAHGPHILADPRAGENWSELCVTLVLLGTAWIMADSLGRADA
ncbi:putative membrane protein [Caulobacter ginsengisoli]|uniref:Membrane protein n=1 Tax=Caulobacter ginsengisoli TaxID=400775 RepID=A0ABU0IWH3_9CAUL|nr:hypothetical protein [Caulobacter ginsengisoli]MDQ0466360.1 putative membrane protein [Caulobacter ginsengisoli]